MNAGSLEAHIENLKNGGWEALEGVPEAVKQKIEIRQANSQQDRDTIARAWADFAATPAGAMALQALLDTTLNRTVFFVNLGQEPGAMAMWGAFREGQNALAHELVRQVARGRDSEVQPKPRER